METQQQQSLQRYVKYMLQNRQMIIKFNKEKILEIIQKDLDIQIQDAEQFELIYLEAFPFYMQNWHGWNTIYSDETYENLKTYLKEKLLNIKLLIDEFKNKKHLIVDAPLNIDELLAGNTINNPPCALKITAPEDTWSKLTFEGNGQQNIMLQFDKTLKSQTNFGIKDVINHPFFSMEFRIPDLIYFKRDAPHKIQRYISSSDDFPEIDRAFITNVDGVLPNPKVYTYQFLKRFFDELDVFLINNSAEIPVQTRSEILTVCNTFLEDINETNFCNKTICERAEVSYNIGRSTYYVDSSIKFDKDDPTENLVYRRLITPIIRYSLINCTLSKEDLTPNGFKTFQFNDDSKIPKTIFLQYLNNSVKFKCLLCPMFYTLAELQEHFSNQHPLDSMLQCTKCFKSHLSLALLYDKWKHDCNPISY